MRLNFLLLSLVMLLAATAVWAQTDVGVGKNTRFGKDERYNLQFRWEAFNFFNRANFNQPTVVVNVASPRFGSITSAGRPREMQFGMKLEF